MSLFGDVHWTADAFIDEMRKAQKKKMNPLVVLQQLEQLALSHPAEVAIIADAINAAAHSENPLRAVIRHLAENVSDELADELSKLTPVE